MKFHALTIPTMLMNVSLWCAVLKSSSSSILASAFGVATSTSATSQREIATSTTALGMAQQRGLERRQEGATPIEGGMELYCKAGPDGTAVGDCPFAHYVRLVLEEKGLEYELKPTVPETKPVWLMEHYQGKLPALRHRKECYVDSDVICEYLDYFFPETPLQGNKQATDRAQDAVAGLFPAIAKYLKHTPDGDAEDTELLSVLVEKMGHLETFLVNKKNQKDGSSSELFMVGDQVTLQDCSLAPKLYHLQSGAEAFKGQAINIPVQYPAVQLYMDGFFARDSFQKTAYPKETVAWGWGNARK